MTLNPLDVFQEILQKEGYAVTTAVTTTAALRAMVEYEFDMVITDLVMCVDVGAQAEADGREVLIAAKKASDKTKVIVVTGYPEMSRIADLFRVGVALSRLKTMAKRRSPAIQFAICIATDDPDLLTPRRIYTVLPDPNAARSNYIRVVDNEGEDYLYPADYFILIDFPGPVKRALLRAS